VMPSAAGLFRRIGEKLPIEKDNDSEPQLRDYIKQSASEENRVVSMIDEIVLKGERIVVWGVGTHTLHLMKTTNLTNANIAAFVDVNTKYHGKELFGRAVIAPQEMAQRSEPILISSRAFQNDIAGMIRDELKLSNRFIYLYDENLT
jgi:hypothetical protein